MAVREDSLRAPARIAPVSVLCTETGVSNRPETRAQQRFQAFTQRVKNRESTRKAQDPVALPNSGSGVSDQRRRGLSNATKQRLATL